VKLFADHDANVFQESVQGEWFAGEWLEAKVLIESACGIVFCVNSHRSHPGDAGDLKSALTSGRLDRGFNQERRARSAGVSCEGADAEARRAQP